MARLILPCVISVLLLATAAMAAPLCPTCGDEPRFPEETNFLAAQGYSANDYTVLLSWSELSRNGSGQYVTGYHVMPASGGQPFDLYSDGTGALLSDAEVAALGIPAKNWALPPVERSAELPAAVEKALPPPPVPVGPAHALPPGADVAAPPVDVGKALQEDEVRAQTGEKGPQRIGLNVALDRDVAVQGLKATDGTWQAVPGKGWLWSVALFSPGALGMRVHFSEVELPPGAQVVVYNYYAPQEAYGPYLGPAPGQSDLWTATTFSDGVVVECLVPSNSDRSAVQLTIDRVTHNYVPLGEVSWAKAAGACNLDVSCYSGWINTSKAVGGIGTVGNSGALWCSGSLLADNDPSSSVPYFLTANHCVNTAAGAASVEVYWLYQTSTCNGAPPSPSTVPRTTGGATLLATGTATTGTDFCLLRLNNPAASGVTYAGWATTPTPLGTSTVCIHHPSGDYKRITFGVVTDVPEYSRESHPATRYYQSSWTAAVTEPGSSGSPLFNGSTQQVIGQLWGGPSSCDPASTDLDYYGRFDVSYPLMEAYLNPPPPPPNDNFAGRAAIAGAPLVVHGTNIQATGEPDDPSFLGWGRTVWWSWTAPSTGAVTIDTIGSDFDTLLGVYTGTSLTSLLPVAEDDDGAIYDLASEVTIGVAAGVTYAIGVDGYGGESGDIILNISAVGLGYTITLESNPPDVAWLSGDGVYPPGTPITVYAESYYPGSYTFVEWTEGSNVVSWDAEYSFTVDANRTLTANFQYVPDYYIVTVSAFPPEGGEAYADEDWVMPGMSTTVHASANPGYEFVNWTEGGVVLSTDADYEFVVNSDRWIEANFARVATIIGNTTVFSQTVQPTNRPAMPFTVVQDGTLESVSMYHGPGTGNMLLGVYATGTNGLPGPRLGVTASTPVSTTAGWQTIPLTSPVPVTAGQTIWLAWVYQNRVNVYYQAGSPGRAVSSAGWAAGMPNPFGASSQGNNVYSIYATYGPGGQTTIGNTAVFSQTVQPTNRPAMPFTVTQSGVLESVSMYHGPGTGNMLLGVYGTGTNGLPGPRRGLTAATPVSATAGWQTIPLTSPVPVAEGETIWLAWVYQNPVSVYYQAGSPGRAVSSAGYASGLPDPFGPSTQGNNVYSIYATYGTSVARTIGNTAVFSQAVQPTNRPAMPFTMVEDGVLQSVSMYHGPGTGNMILGVYGTGSNGLPGARLGLTAATPVSAAAGWQTVPLTSPVPVTAGQTIWLAWVFQNRVNVYYQAGSPGRAVSSAGYAAGMPNPFGTSSQGNNVYSIYATYVPAPTTLGNTAVFGQSVQPTNRPAMPFTMAENGTLESVSMYHGPGSGNMLLGVYAAGTNGLPGSRLGVTASTPVSATAGWQTIPLTSPVPVAAGQTVWLAWVFQNPVSVYYQAGSPGRAVSTAGWAAGMPTAFGPSTQGNNVYSIYTTYLPENVALSSDVPLALE